VSAQSGRNPSSKTAFRPAAEMLSAGYSVPNFQKFIIIIIIIKIW